MNKKIFIIIPIIIAIILISLALLFYLKNSNLQKAEHVLKQYFALLEGKNYEELYNLVILPENYSKDKFLTRNKNIYDGIEATNFQIEITSIKNEKNDILISYLTKMDITGGNVEFENTATLSKKHSKEYKINWSSNLIFPELNNEYKVRVSRVKAKRGSLLDRNGKVIAYSETDRIYPFKDATAHVTGYIQGITAEELKKLPEYTTSSKIGKTGLELAYEERLKGTDGTKIYIENNEGNIIKTLSEIPAQNGEDIKLTIDIDMQLNLYNQIENDEGFFVVINPKTGEILALVSTPSYDSNKFIQGMTNEEWDSLSNNDKKPLYSRFLGSWCPGSTMKPLTGAIGLTSGTLSENDEFIYSSLAWQKDSSWENHKITTLTSYTGKKNLRNALIYSDNIYFAQATIQIGCTAFTKGLDKLMFNKNIDFILPISKSQYSNTETIQSEAMLADSGYGQGQVLVNPIHMASIYSAFVNEGNMVKPYIEYKEEKNVEYLVENAFSKKAANEIKEDLIQAVENPAGTGHDVKVSGITIAGKTGTAELKISKEANGDTLGWFNCFTTDQSDDKSLLIISMAKNKKSSYLKKIIKTLF